MALSSEDKLSMSESPKPVDTVPSWFQSRSREFRYTIPAEFEFAYIDRTGKVVMYGPFLMAESFSHGVAPVTLWMYAMEGDKLKVDDSLSFRQISNSLLREDGTFVKTQYIVKPFIDADFAVANNGGRSLIVDKNGQARGSFDATWVGNMSEGLIPICGDQSGNVKVTVSTYEAKHNADGEIEVSQSGLPKWGYIDIAGEYAIAPKFDHAAEFSEGLAKVQKDLPWTARRSRESMDDSGKSAQYSQVGYIDKTGKMVVPYKYQDGRSFKDGLAAVKFDDKWGYIDAGGTVVISFSYDFAFDFADGLAAVERDEKVGFIDRAGKLVIPMQFADAKCFDGGIAPATSDGRNWGFIDKSGKFAIEPKFLGAFPFNGTRALVYIKQRDEIGTDVSEVPFLLKLAQAARSRSQIEPARVMFKRVIELAPQSDDAKIAQAFIKTALPAVPVPEAAIELYERGCDLASADDKSASLKLLEECVKKYPEFDWAYGALGQVLTMDAKYAEAETVLKQVLQRNPDYLKGYYRLAELYQEMGKHELSKSMFDKARSLNPDDDVFQE